MGMTSAIGFVSLGHHITLKMLVQRLSSETRQRKVASLNTLIGQRPHLYGVK